MVMKYMLENSKWMVYCEKSHSKDLIIKNNGFNNLIIKAIKFLTSLCFNMQVFQQACRYKWLATQSVHQLLFHHPL